MQTISTIKEIKEKIFAERVKNISVGFVPTMGYFHHGHLDLLKRSVSENDITVVSIFVNPIQFLQNEDLGSYPRDLTRDSMLAEKCGVDYLFTPDEDEMYPQGFNSFVEVKGYDDILCAKARPGHFKGVATIVSKLFNIVEPDKSYFGLKDYQQFRIVEKMTKELNFKTSIEPVGIARDIDGLAASSRNSYLSNEERQKAVFLHKALLECSRHVSEGQLISKNLISMMKEMIDKVPQLQLEYIHVVDRVLLRDIEKVESGKSLAILAAKIGNTRLIDNTEI